MLWTTFRPLSLSNRPVIRYCFGEDILLKILALGLFYSPENAKLWWVVKKKTKKKTTTFNCFKVGTPIYITDRFLQVIYNLYRIKENRLKMMVFWFFWIFSANNGTATVKRDYVKVLGMTNFWIFFEIFGSTQGGVICPRKAPRAIYRK